MHDSHIHSIFSSDALMEAQDACKKAVEIGLTGITFTDHVDLDYPDNSIALIDFKKYFNFFENLKKHWSQKLNVLIGVEIGYQLHILEENLQLLRENNFDFIINSVHVIDRMDPYYSNDFFKGKTQSEAYERYLQEVLLSVRAFEHYDVIGHIGYAARYGNFQDNRLKYSDHSDILDLILKSVIEKGKGIEVNTSGLRTDLASTIPGNDILKRYHALGGEIITLGSDAHHSEYLGLKFNETAEVLKNIGFKYITHFENRKPVFESI